MRHLVIILGDQLDRRAAAFDGFDPSQDRVWMAEAPHESTPLRSSLPRIALFLACMRHFRDALRAEGLTVEYRCRGAGSLVSSLAADLARLRPQAVVLMEPGDWGLREALRGVLQGAGVEVMEREDRHFLCTHAEFRSHARGRKQLRMEFFYREMRRRHEVLLDAQGGPEGGEWNYDSENRKSFGRGGPGALGLAMPIAFAPDALTRTVLDEVAAAYPDHPGSLAAFDWPVTRDQALQALADFVDHRLAAFGDWQDAMWTGEPWLFHSRLSAALNLKLLDPREVIAATEAAYRAGRAPLAAVEGFIRQILGWREYVRGIYWLQMPDYIDRNTLGATEPLPTLYWSGDTDMVCLREAVGQTLRLGYAHHIQRLMVTGLFALLVGVDPREVHRWYLSVYVDAHEWVELPNTLGMSQYADGGVMASKPYIASGRYISRMGNHCAGCRYDPGASTGAKACPFTTLYWDFLLRHETALAANPRMVMQVRNLRRLDGEAQAAIRRQAVALRAALKGA